MKIKYIENIVGFSKVKTLGNTVYNTIYMYIILGIKGIDIGIQLSLRVKFDFV